MLRACGWVVLGLTRLGCDLPYVILIAIVACPWPPGYYLACLCAVHTATTTERLQDVWKHATNIIKSET